MDTGRAVCQLKGLPSNFCDFVHLETVASPVQTVSNCVVTAVFSCLDHYGEYVLRYVAVWLYKAIPSDGPKRVISQQKSWIADEPPQHGK